MPLLRFKLSGQEEETHLLSGDRVTVGRRPDNIIQILDPSVSAYHAELIAVGGHYRLRDLCSTNLTCVDGQPIEDFHLRTGCTLRFGSVECAFALAVEVDGAGSGLSRAQLEQEIAFLRSENSEIRDRNRALERRIGILNSAQIFGEKRGQERSPALSDALKAMTAERDAERHRAATLQAELEHTREELAIAARAREAAREAAGMLQVEKATMQREIRASGIRALPIAV